MINGSLEGIHSSYVMFIYCVTECPKLTTGFLWTDLRQTQCKKVPKPKKHYLLCVLH